MRTDVSFMVFFCLILAVCIAGCTSTNPVGIAAATPSPAVPETTMTYGTVITAIPSVEIARIQQDILGVPGGHGSVFQFGGKITINGGVYHAVGLIMRYPDGTEYSFDAGSMGGASPVVRNFVIYPDSRYQNQVPAYFITLDGKNYATVYRYTDGTIFRIASSDSAVTATS